MDKEKMNARELTEKELEMVSGGVIDILEMVSGGVIDISEPETEPEPTTVITKYEVECEKLRRIKDK